MSVRWFRLYLTGLVLMSAGCYTQTLSDSTTTAAAVLTPMTPANTPQVMPTALTLTTPIPAEAGTLLIHTVQRGETLFQIAQFYQVSRAGRC
ncbi:MAG TPA: LysM domain-containing protein [Phototrophicaceae bacterium]|nr:LysM domain-containing protein [Phototrophicaceae bacterium]